MRSGTIPQQTPTTRTKLVIAVIVVVLEVGGGICTAATHCPQAGEHSRPPFRQEHLRLLQSDAQLQRMIRRRASGAAGLSVMIGRSRSCPIAQPYFCASVGLTSSPFNCLTCRYTLRLCFSAAADVGGRFCGCT